MCRCNEMVAGGSLQEAVRAVYNCTLCRVDLQTKGEYTGNGLRAIKALIAKYGWENVNAEWSLQGETRQ